jgi:hypothetical protein
MPDEHESSSVAHEVEELETVLDQASFKRHILAIPFSVRRNRREFRTHGETIWRGIEYAF